MSICCAAGSTDPTATGGGIADGRRHGGHEGRPLRLALPAAETAESTDAAYHHRTDHYNGYDGPGHASGAAAGVVAAMSSTARTILTIRTGTFTVVAPSCAAGSVLALPETGAFTIAAVTRAAR